VVACGSQNQRIKLMSLQGKEISTIRYHDGFLGQRIGPVSALAFHPRSAVMAAGATDSIISIYSGVTRDNSR
jgi:regulator-associated protein of mTOR